MQLTTRPFGPKKFKDYKFTDRAEWVALLPSLRPAGLYETMGPHWKDIYWNPIGKPYVKK